MIFSGCSSNNYSPTCTEEIILNENSLTILIDNFKRASEKFNLKYSGYNSKFPSGKVVTVAELSLNEVPLFSFVNLKTENKYMFSVYKFKDKDLKLKVFDVIAYGLNGKLGKCE